MTPGFVDIHTHLDAQLAWDPLPTSSCWHGVTSVVLGNCGVTFAPVRPGDREVLAEMMESVEDIPRDAILEGLPWDWTTYGEYLGWLDRIDKGLNVGGMVGHCAVRVAAMGERSLDEAPAHCRRHRRHGRSGRRSDAAPARSASPRRARSCTACPTAARCRARSPRPRSCSPSATCSAAWARGVFESACRLGERDTRRARATPGPRWRGWARCRDAPAGRSPSG